MRYDPRTLDERFWEKVAVTDGCWEWTASRQANGYGQFWRGGGVKIVAHRLAWELTNGPVPDGMQLDHLCRNRGCCNPSHLEVVTPRENTLRSPINPAAINARKTHCPAGHPFDARTKNGRRMCLRCRRAYANERARRMN